MTMDLSFAVDPSASFGSKPDRPVGTVLRLAVLALFGASLIACGGGDEAPQPSPQTPPAGVAPQPAAPAEEAPPADEGSADEDTRSAVEIFQAAGKALADERLFEPPGDNALV